MSYPLGANPTMIKRLRHDRPDRLRLKATYGLETALLLGLACLGLFAHRPDRPGAGLMLVVGLLLLALAGASLWGLRASGVPPQKHQGGGPGEPPP